MTIMPRVRALLHPALVPTDDPLKMVRKVEATIAANLAADPHFYDDPNAPRPRAIASTFEDMRRVTLGTVEAPDLIESVRRRAFGSTTAFGSTADWSTPSTTRFGR